MDYIFLFFIILVLFVLRWFYNIIFEFLTNGMSIGKYLLKIRVININGDPLDLTSIILRNFLRIIDQTLSSYLGVFFSMVFDKYFRRIGDLVAGTIVIREEKFNPKIPDFSLIGVEENINFERKPLVNKLTEKELYILKKFLNSQDNWPVDKKEKMILKMVLKIKNRINEKDREITDGLQYLKEIYMRHINEQ